MARKREPDAYLNSIEPPTYRSASYCIDDADQVRQTFHVGAPTAGRYGRYSNPTWLDVEARLSQLSRADSSLLFASGMAAHFTTFMALLRAGDEMLLPAESYRQVRALCHQILPKFGVTVHEMSIRNTSDFIDRAQELRDRLRLVHLEMPSSPHMFLIDIDEVRRVLAPSTVVTMDSSFAPPPNFYAVDWGIDLVLFSATKYLGGHGDIVAGVVSGKSELIDHIRWYRDVTGSVADGEVAALLRRSLYTLSLRLAHVNELGIRVARHLEAHRRVRRVYYPGLESHVHHHLACKYLSGHGGVVTFELGLTEVETAAFVDRLKVPYMASNFGAPQSLVEQSTFFTYFEYDDEELRSIGVDRSTVRIAIGFTDTAEELVCDLDQALA